MHVPGVTADIVIFSIGFILGILAYKNHVAIKHEVKEDLEVIKTKLSKLESKIEDSIRKKL